MFSMALLPSLAACLVPQLRLAPLRATSASSNHIARASAAAGSGEGFGYGEGYDPELTAALELVEVGCCAARDLQSGIVEAKSSTAKADTSGTGFGVSPVTVADFTVQCLLLGALAQRFPNDRFIAEETSAQLLAADAATRAAVVAAAERYSGGGGADGLYSELFEGWAGIGSEADACAALDLGLSGTVDGWSATGRTWVLDPIDGTKGFLRGDQYAICLSLLDGGRPVVGLLGCPNLSPTDARASAATGCAAGGTLAWAVRGGGAFACAALQEAQLPQLSQADARVRNRRPTRVSAAVAPARVGRCEAFEAGHSSRGKAAAAAAALGLTAEPVRMDGQGKYAVLARGEAQLFTRLPRAGYRENIWDVAAGALLVEEAGGRVSDLEGMPLDFSRGAQLGENVRGVVATNGGAFHDDVLQALRDAPDDCE